MKKPEQRLKAGDHVRAKERTILGWKWTGVVLENNDGSILIQKDSIKSSADSVEAGKAVFRYYQLAKIRKIPY